jgi:cytochrome c-type biogenesis protein CcmE
VTEAFEAPHGETGSSLLVSRRRRRQKRRLVVFGVILLAAFGFLLTKGLTSSLNYFVTVNQAEKERATLGSSTVQLEGLVVPGTVHTEHSGVSFTMESDGVSQAVVNIGSPPELFQANIPVVVVGHFSGALFRSNQILVKHSASYVAQYPSRVKAPNGTSR